MKILRRLRRSSWLPAAIVFAIVLAAGSRLIVLSVRAHAAEARRDAEAAAQLHARALARELDGLAAIASGTPRAMPARVFEWRPGGTVIAAAGADSAAAHAIASEWTAEGGGGPPRSGVIVGPLREGSEWLIAALAPTGRVAYTSLDQLLASTKLGRLTGAGYDFALVQRDRAGEPERTFLASQTEPLGRAAEADIATPAGFAFLSGQPLALEVRPRAGWYPTRTLATDIGLLALTAWLLTFIAHDLTQRTRRLRAALETSRRQLRAANERLVNEIEQRHELEESVDRARFRDPFTGLPNRRCFMDQLDRALRDARIGRGPRIAVFLIDIERFQLINETLGHTAGDELMVQAARRFEQTAAPSIGILARWGGDQFALLARGIDTTDAAMGLAQSLHEALREPFELRRHRLAITARVGMTCVASGPQRADDVVREADIALSVAKRTENSLSVAYTPSMGGDAASLVSLEADLHVALERRELTLLFQPIVDLRGPRAVGAEALLRWRHPVEGLLRPDRFLPIAEEAGLMVPITRWAVRRVCRLAGEWRKRLPPDAAFYLSVNLSAAVLRDPELADYVAGLLEETATPPDTLKFELTEGGLISNVGGARDALQRLRRTGVQLMLDDFGTGYSSLNHLQLFPFDYVKIDRPIAGGAGERGASLASAMVQLAASLGLTPIAEVVESQSTADALEKMGCHYGQGNFYCAPVDPEEALACLRGGTPAQAGAIAGSGAETDETREWIDDSPTLMLPADFLSEDSAEA
ncbi:MAG TPA: bifunctional diguanylate cyclase/phosphodiesterase [Steroidobacteraceae bacterium]|nr:bifunctional diguanylate cyclase/phosphodiesterase [Steroidobacteraceae bacterium]